MITSLDLYIFLVLLVYFLFFDAARVSIIKGENKIHKTHITFLRYYKKLRIDRKTPTTAAAAMRL